MIENMKGGSLKFWKSLPFPYKTSFWENWFCNSCRSHFLRPHFRSNVLEVDMVSFTEASLLLAREGGGAKILNTLYHVFCYLSSWIYRLHSFIHVLFEYFHSPLYIETWSRTAETCPDHGQACRDLKRRPPEIPTWRLVPSISQMIVIAVMHRSKTCCILFYFDIHERGESFQHQQKFPALYSAALQVRRWRLSFNNDWLLLFRDRSKFTGYSMYLLYVSYANEHTHESLDPT